MFDLILDRDGILNVDVGYTHRLEDFRLPDQTVEALVLLSDLGARFSIATGQSGITRGKYTEADLHRFNKRLVQELAPHGIEFAAIAFCPHHPDISGDCECRKPKLGMLRQIESKLGSIDWNTAWGIGDKPSDAEMLLTIGGQSVLVRSGQHNNSTGESYWSEDDPELASLLKNPRNHVADSLWDAAQIIKGNVG